MSKQIQTLKTVKATLWQPISDQQSETVKGGFYHTSNGSSFCNRTKKLMGPARYFM